MEFTLYMLKHYFVYYILLFIPHSIRHSILYSNIHYMSNKVTRLTNNILSLQYNNTIMQYNNFALNLDILGCIFLNPPCKIILCLHHTQKTHPKNFYKFFQNSTKYDIILLAHLNPGGV